MKLPSKFQIGDTVGIKTLDISKGIVKEIHFSAYYTMPQYNVVVCDFGAIRCHTLMEDMLLPIPPVAELTDEVVEGEYKDDKPGIEGCV